MYEIKKWCEVLTIISGKDQKDVENPSGKYPIYGSGGIIGRADKYLCEENTVIVGRKGTINNPIFVDEPFWNIDTAFGIAAGKELLPKFLFYFCKLFNFTTLDKSTGRPSISKSDLLKIEMPVPPLDEQDRIVSRIEELFSELDAGVEMLRKTQRQLETYRQAVYVYAYEKYNINNKNITDFFAISAGLTKNPDRKKMPIKKPYLRVANVYFNSLDLTEIKEIGILPQEITEKLLKKDDLLFVEGNGSKNQIGRVAIWDGTINNCVHQNHIIKARPNGKMLSSYALFYFISKFGRKQILSVASSTSGLYTLSANKIRNLNIPYCSLD